jgi:hypothetical protein
MSVDLEPRNRLRTEWLDLQVLRHAYKEYLISDRLPDNIAKDFKSTTARAAVVQVSLSYLLGIDHSLLIAQIRQNFPFASYAAQYWTGQAVMVEMDSEETQQPIAEFFTCVSAYHGCYLLYQVDDPYESGFELEENERCPSPLFYASITGLIWSCQMLLEKDADVNAQGGYFGSAIGAASSNGYLDMVKTLLTTKSVGTHQSDQPGSEILLHEARKRCEDVVGQEVAESSVDPNLRNVFGRIPLFLALKEGNALVVAELLRHHQVDPDSEDRYSLTPLAVAAAYGHVETVNFLLTASVCVDAQDIFRRTPLLWARQSRSSYIEQLLINQGDGAPQSAEIVKVPVFRTKSGKAVYWCDICTLSFVEGETYQHCMICMDGDFDICLQCFNLGARCLDIGHKLVSETS